MRHGPKVRITTRSASAQVGATSSAHGGTTILVGRFIGLVRALAPFIAGSSGMRYTAALSPTASSGQDCGRRPSCCSATSSPPSLNEATEIQPGGGRWCSGSPSTLIVGVVLAIRFMRDAGEPPPARGGGWSGTPLLRPVVAVARRIEPQVSFLWERVTPGRLGLEFTWLMAGLAVSALRAGRLPVVIRCDPGPTPGDSEAFEVVEDLEGLDHDVSACSRRSARRRSPWGGRRLSRCSAARRRWLEVVLIAGCRDPDQIGFPVIKDAVDRPRPPVGWSRRVAPAFPAATPPTRSSICGLRWCSSFASGRGWPAAPALAAGIALAPWSGSAGCTSGALPERRQRRLGAGRGGVRPLRGGRSAHHPVAAECGASARLPE